MLKQLLLFLLLLNTATQAQVAPPPFIKLVQPFNSSVKAPAARQYIIGSTCANCKLSINEQPVKVHATGAFAFLIDLAGDSSFIIRAEGESKVVTRTIQYQYTTPQLAKPVATTDIVYLQTLPEGDLVLQAGDVIKLKAKALPAASLKTSWGSILYEMPVANTGGMPGIYQGEYVVKPSDTFMLKKMMVTLTDSAGKTISRETSSKFSVQSAYASDVAITKGRLAHLEYGLGDDRLGGAKIGYLDSNILLKLTGKFGNDYRVQLAPGKTAYIPGELVQLLPKGSYPPASLTDKITVLGDSLYDYVRLQLFARLPYQSMQFINPSTIVVDVYGATNNTNWITQLETAKEIKSVDYEQLAEGIFRVSILLNHPQHWGHQLYYQGNTLVIKVKRQPANSLLKHLVIAVDAGHGGSNNGAVGATGIYEKELTLALSLKLQQALEKEGAKVIMTRTTEQFFDNKERILFYRDSMPDLLLSIHLNSSADPFFAGGTGTFYRYIGFKPLSNLIYKRLLQLGLNEYGNTGSFNFMLNSPTEYPNALIETLFLSNLDEEAKIINPIFQQQMADKIVAGIKDFLEHCKNTH
jgi:N-acetylmuramoyl-L-alanine amidase